MTTTTTITAGLTIANEFVSHLPLVFGFLLGAAVTLLFAVWASRADYARWKAKHAELEKQLDTERNKLYVMTKNANLMRERWLKADSKLEALKATKGGVK